MAGKRTYAERYRFNRRGDVVLDERQMTDAYLHPDANHYRKGDPLFVPKPSSNARLAFKAVRALRRVKPAAAMRAVHAAATPKVTGDTVAAELTREAAEALADFIIADAELRGATA